MSHMGWQRRSSSLRLGGRTSQDPLKQPGARFVDRSSRIPLPSGSSVQQSQHRDPPGLKRSHSNLGPNFTPQQNLASAGKITPLANIITPKFFGSYSSKKPGYQKDQRNLHDKEFQRNASHLVLNYFQNNYSTALKGSDIRPMTIKMFLEMVNHLMARLGIYNKDELVQFTSGNYEKEMPHWVINVLGYPCNISKQWLQTVNVPQCWPNVLGLLSWLVSLVQVTSKFDLETQLKQGIDEDKAKLFNVTYLNGCLAAHNRNMAGDENAIKDISEEVAQISEQINGLTDEVFAQLRAENDKLREKVSDPDLKVEQDTLEELEQRLNVAESLNMRAVEDMDKKRESIDNFKAAVTKKETNISSLRMEIERVGREVMDLKKRVESQSMSVTEFVEIQKKCDYLLKEISYMEKECEDNKKLISRYEQEIAAKRDKILQETSAFNRQIIQLEQQVPELQGLRARMNPESADVVEEVESLVQALRELKTQLTAQWENLEALCKEQQLGIESLKQRLCNASASEINARERIISKKVEIEQLKAEIEEKEQAFKSEVQELEKRQLVCTQKEKENDRLRDDAAKMEKKLELLEKGKEMMEVKVEAMWRKLEEKARFFNSEIITLRDKIKNQEHDMERLIDQLVKEMHE